MEKVRLLASPTCDAIPRVFHARVGAAGSEADERAGNGAGQTRLPREATSECTFELSGNVLLFPIISGLMSRSLFDISEAFLEQMLASVALAFSFSPC